MATPRPPLSRPNGRYASARLIPSCICLTVGLAYAHFGAGRFEDAAIAAGRASQSNPKFTMPHVLHAAALASLGRHPEAMAEVDRLRELDPQLTVGPAIRSTRYVDAAKNAELGNALRRAGLPG